MNQRSIRVLVAATSIVLGGTVLQAQDRGPTNANNPPAAGSPAADRAQREGRDQQQPAQPPATHLSDRARVAADTAPSPVSPTDQRQIRESLARIVENATTPGKTHDLVALFSVVAVTVNKKSAQADERRNT